MQTKNASTTVIKKHSKSHSLDEIENSKDLEHEPTSGVKASDIKSIMSEEPTGSKNIIAEEILKCGSILKC